MVHAILRRAPTSSASGSDGSVSRRCHPSAGGRSGTDRRPDPAALRRVTGTPEAAVGRSLALATGAHDPARVLAAPAPPVPHRAPAQTAPTAPVPPGPRRDRARARPIRRVVARRAPLRGPPRRPLAHGDPWARPRTRPRPTGLRLRQAEDPLLARAPRSSASAPSPPAAATYRARPPVAPNEGCWRARLGRRPARSRRGD